MRNWISWITRSKAGKRAKYRKQSGITLMEIAIGLAVAAIAGATMAEYMADNSRTIRAAGVASKINEIYKAAEQYVAEDFEDLLAAAGSGAPVVVLVGKDSAGGAVPAGSLQDMGYLSPSFIDRNGYNQRHAVLIKQPDPAHDRLSILVTTWDGRPMEDNQLAKVSGYIGAHGGIILNNPPSGAPSNTVLGSFGGWQTPASDWTFNPGGGNRNLEPGYAMAHFTMARDERGVRVNEFLHRVPVAGHPELNQMAVDLDMDSHNIDNIDQFYADGGEITNNLDVGRDLDVNRDINVGRHAQVGGNATVVSNLNVGVNVSAGGSVSAANNVGAGINVTAGNNVRAQNNVEAVSGDLISGRDASVARDIDVTRNARVGHRMGIGVPVPTGSHQGFQNTLAVNGNITTSDGGIIVNSNNGSSRPTFVQWRHGNSTDRNLFACFDDSGDQPTGRRRLAFHYNAPECISSPRIHFDMSGPSAEDRGSGHFMGNLSTGHDLIAERDLQVDGSGSIAEQLTVGGISAPASAAAGDIVAKDIWLEDAQRWASEGILYANIVQSGQTVPKPQCRSGGTPHIFLSPVFFSDNGDGMPLLGVRAYATNHTNHWTVNLTVFTPDETGMNVKSVDVLPNYGRMMALAKCHV